jgi:hypothetical protein
MRRERLPVILDRNDLPSFRDPPPAPASTLTRCLRNRVKLTLMLLTSKLGLQDRFNLHHGRFDFDASVQH